MTNQIAYRKPNVQNKKSLLCIENTTASDLAEKYGTPLYVYSKNQITNKFTLLRKAFDKIRTRNSLRTESKFKRRSAEAYQLARCWSRHGFRRRNFSCIESRISLRLDLARRSRENGERHRVCTYPEYRRHHSRIERRDRSHFEARCRIRRKTLA